MHIVYVKGTTNRVADALLRYFLNEEAEAKHRYDMVSADTRLDPEGETLTNDQITELQSGCILDRREPRETEADKIARHLHPREQAPNDGDLDPTAAESTGQGPPLDTMVLSNSELLNQIKVGYSKDPVLKKILGHPTDHARFQMEDGVIRHLSRDGNWVVCIPKIKIGRRMITEIIIHQAHESVGHLGARRTGDYVRRWYWWPSIGHEIDKFCRSCGRCQTTKVSNQRPARLLHSMPAPDRPWHSIAMDFVGPFPECEGKDYLWVVVDRFTVTMHLIPTVTTMRASELAWIFIREIVHLHGLPALIVSDWDSKFVSKFWKEVHRLLGGKLLMSTAYHPQTDGQSEQMIRTVSQMLRAAVQPDQRDWAGKIPMVEFAINSSWNASTGFAPFELSGGFMPSMIRELADEPALPGVRDFAERALDYLHQAHDSLISSRVEQTHHANQ